VQIAKKARVAGLKAIIFGRVKPGAKRLEISTRNPILLAREFGDTARPDIGGLKRRFNQSADDGFLYVRVKTRGRKKKVTKPYGTKRTGRAEERNRKLRAAGFEVRKVQQVRIKAVLGMRSRWRSYIDGPGRAVLDKAISETIRRANLIETRRIERATRATA
jgi:hypothetical protein